MKTTRYFRERVLPKRPYIDPSWCAAVIASPLRHQTQADGRIRFWGRVQDPRNENWRILRVVTLSDGETVHNAFFDRSYR